MTSEADVVDGALLIRGGRIDRIMPLAELSDRTKRTTQIIDVTGSYIFPGFVDLHVHAKDWDSDYWPVSPRDLFVAHGVTTVRVCDGYRSNLDQLSGIESLNRGPRVVLGVSDRFSDPVSVVGSAGTRFLKVKNTTDLNDLMALTETAEAAGVYTIAHLHEFQTLTNALSVGLDEIAHIREIQRVATDSDWLQSIVESDTVVHTTLSVLEGVHNNATNPTSLLESPAARYLPDDYRRDLKYGASSEYGVALAPEEQVQYNQRDGEILRLLHEAGVTLVAGSDAGSGFYGTIAGLQMHAELRAVAAAGIDPIDALRMATSNAYEVSLRMGLKERFGVIQERLFADLVVFDEDPRVSLEALDSISSVFVQGNHYDSAWIESVLNGE